MVHFELKKSLWFCFFPAKLTSPKSTGLKQPSSIAHDFVDQVYKKGSLRPAALTSWSIRARGSTSHLWEGTIQGCTFQEAFFFFFFGGAEDLCKLSHTVIILTKVENDGWDHLYTFFHLLDSMNLIGTCLIGSRMILLIPVLLPLRNSQCYSCWLFFNFFPRIWKQHALPTSDTFAIYKPISVISPLISLCVLKCELSSYLKFKCRPGLPSNMWNFEDESQSVNIFTFEVCCKRHQK